MTAVHLLGHGIFIDYRDDAAVACEDICSAVRVDHVKRGNGNRLVVRNRRDSRGDAGGPLFCRKTRYAAQQKQDLAVYDDRRPVDRPEADRLRLGRWLRGVERTPWQNRRCKDSRKDDAAPNKR